jgi:molybdopterin-containing oxidoreductase family iron-sulfur binding subunit
MKTRDSKLEIDRRKALALLAGGLASTLTSCGPPAEEIVPYVTMPEGVTPGLPLQFATAVPLSGYAQGVLATSYDGRPTRLDGNPKHPTSGGAIDIFAQAEIMSLYSPDRAQAVGHGDDIAAWSAFEGALAAQLAKEKARHGAGLRIVTGRITSPTLIRQLRALGEIFPEARWLRHEPIDDDATRAGTKLAFGQPYDLLPHIDRARTVLTLDADVLGPGPHQVLNAAAFAKVRQSQSLPEAFLRLYAVESMWRLTGANADERLALHPALMGNVALHIARALGAQVETGELPEHARRFVEAAANDLTTHKGQAMVLAGDTQSPEVHALCHWINAQLAAPVDLIPPVDINDKSHARSLQELVDDLDAGRARTLIVIDCNPVYASPSDLKIGDLFDKAEFSACLGPSNHETARRCQWRLPMSHALESWSDLRAVDGTASIVQPLIRPLYDTRSAHHLVGLLAGTLSADPYALVRETWAAQASGDFDANWKHWLHDGVIPDTVAKPVTPSAPKLPNIAPPQQPALTLVVAPDPSLWDGRFADNAWLQECPRPLTHEVWGNSLKLSRSDAAARELADGDVVRLSRGGVVVEAPVKIVPGQPVGVVAAALGSGRKHAGAIGSGVGFEVYPLRTIDAPWLIEGVGIEKTGAHMPLLTTQHHFKLDAEDKDILRTLPIADLPRGTASSRDRGEDLPSLLPQQNMDGHQWAMVIDTSVCIGCNACVIACQSENNVPVVGPEEVAMGRIMQWLRVDTYFVHGEERPPGFQPVPCMHCEHAPCEPVCPVAASVHDGEGLNAQVYNRCIGTRFCQSNCPYKVRRFNWFAYSHDQAYANLGETSVEAQYNPDVTVRGRGVMEKCTYCVQRISRARRESEKTDTPIPDGRVVTACQSACPTRAIGFGDLNVKDAHVNALRHEPHHYAMLGHLGTRPRTTYLARLDNRNPALREDES